MTQAYEIEAPDGRKFRIEGDIPPTEQELDDIFAQFPAAQVQQEPQQPQQPIQQTQQTQPEQQIQQPQAALQGGISQEVMPQYQDIFDNPNLTREQRIAEIQRRGAEEQKQLDKELRRFKTKAYAGAALEIGSAAIPFGGAAKLGASLVKPVAGQLVKRAIARGAAQGLASGAMFGIGRGLMEDKDVAGTLGTAAQDALIGGLLGRVGGKVGAMIDPRMRNIVQRRATPLAERSEVLAERLTRPEIRYLEKSVAIRKGKGGPTIEQNIETAPQVQQITQETIQPRQISQSVQEAATEISQQALKNTGLPQSVIKAKGTPQKVKNILRKDIRQYEQITNPDLTARAVQEVESNFANELSRLSTAKDFDALDYEKTRQISKRLFDSGEHQQAINLIDNVAENATKKGQAIQALSLWSNMTPEGAVYKAQKLVREYNKKAGKSLELTDEQIDKIRAQQLKALNEIDEYKKRVELAKTAKLTGEIIPKNFAQKLKTYRNISLLLNPKTLGRNIVGNALFNTFDTASKALAVPIDRLIGLKTGQRTRVLPRISESLRGSIEGGRKGYSEALQGIDTKGLGQRFDLGGQRTFTGVPGLQQAETALDVGLRVPDRVFYEGAFSESVANQVRAQGLKEPTQEILQRAEQEALEAVFQNQSLLSKAALGLREKVLNVGQKDFGLGDLAIPYAQTPANLAQQGVNYSPLGVLKGIANLRTGDQRQASLDIARALMGTGIGATGYGLAKEGIATGNLDTGNYQRDKTIRANLQKLGIRPNQLGSAWYAPFQPMSIPLSVGVAAASGENPLKSGINTLVDLPFLQNVSGALSDIKDKGIAEAALNFAGSVPSQFVPTLGSQIGQTIDPYVRETYSSNKLQQGLNQAQAKIPFASRMLPERIDVTGQPMERYQSKGAARLFDIFVNPTFINKPTNDPVISELKVLYDVTGDVRQFLPVVDKKLRFTDSQGEKQELVLNNRQLSDYQKRLGQALYGSLNDLMQTGAYINNNDEGRINLIQQQKSLVKSYVEEEMFNKLNKNTPAYKEQQKIQRKLIPPALKKIQRTEKQNQNQLIENIMQHNL